MGGDPRVDGLASSADVGPSPGAGPTSTDRLGAIWSRHGNRAASLVFAAALVGAAVWWLYIGRHQRLIVDEWFFVTSRGFGPHDLFAPYNSHWTTLPLLAYRLLWAAFGMRSYVPYQLVTVGLQVAAAVLLRAIIRRTGVNPWIATVAASLFLFFGTGAVNVLWAFQMAFSGSLVFGLVHLILVDHDGRVDWRDGLGLAAGLAALMCSDVGVAMVAIVGVAALMRRGLRVAALHTLPLATIFGVWWFVTEDWGRYHLGKGPVALQDVIAFVLTGAGATFGGLVKVPWVAWIAGATLVAGLVVAWNQTAASERRRRFAMPIAMLVGMLVFLVITGIGRAHEGSEHAREGRYLHLQAAMLLPALALAVDALVRRWRILVPLILAVFVVGIPGNIAAGYTYVRSTRVHLLVPEMVTSVGHLPVSRLLPRAYLINFFIPTLTMGWIRDADDSGRLPTSGGLPPRLETQTETRLSLAMEPGPVGAVCRILAQPVTLTLATGEAFASRGAGINVTDLAPTNGTRSALPLAAGDHVWRAVRPLTLRVGSTSEPARLCDVDRGATPAGAGIAQR